MIVQASQLEANVGCDYTMTATDRALDSTQTCGWECVLQLDGNDY